MAYRSFIVSLPFLIALTFAACQSGDPEGIVDSMEARYEENMTGVENFTIYTAGLEAHHRLNTTDSLTAFDLGVSQPDSFRAIPESASLIPFLVADIPKIVRGLRAGAHQLANDTMDGHDVFVIDADNPGLLVMGGNALGNDIKMARVYVDAETYALRGVTVEMLPSDTTLVFPIVQHVRYDQFQDVDGFSLPYIVTATTEGLMQLVSDEMRMVENGNLALNRQQAEMLPPARRDAELASIAARERFLNEGIQEDELTVDSVRVNAAIPPETFGDAITTENQ